MKTTIVTTQAEFDALPPSFPEFTEIEIRADGATEIVVRKTPGSSTVTAYDSSTVRAYDSSTVTACGSSTVTACGSSTVTAYDSSTVTAYDSSTVTACGSSTVRACGSSTVTAYDSSTVTAYDSSTVTAYGSSTVRACGSSTVTACGSSTVTAYDSSTVTACGSSTVTACGSSTVTACGSSTVTAYDSSTVTACGFAVVVLRESAKVGGKGRCAKVVRQKDPKAKTLAQWIDINGAEAKGQFVTLYKRVSADLKTQEGGASETLWAIGSSLVVPKWDPDGSECGAGKFHGCPAPHYCDEFRSKPGDRYVAIKVAKKDCKVWPDAQYPHKIAFRAGTVLHECDKNGRKIG